MYQDLPALLSGSSSTRSYFLSLPVWLQVLLHEDHPYICTALQLRHVAGILLRQRHLSGKGSGG